MTCPSMKRWESTILKINKSATLPGFILFSFFFFACLRHIMAMWIYKTSCTPTFLSACIPLAARGVHAFLEVWLAPELWGSQKPSCF